MRACYGDLHRFYLCINALPHVLHGGTTRGQWTKEVVWVTKEGTYRLKEKLLPDVRDTDVEMVDSSSAHQWPVHGKICDG